ncbi:MAG: hypothetical protein U0237_04710 [Thermoleophilia bacterium]
MRAPAPDAVAALLRLFRPAVVTLAPELEGVPEAVGVLRARGVLVTWATDAG